MYIEQTMAGRSPAEAAAPAAPQPSTPAASERTTAQQRSEETGCSGMNGSLPGACAQMAFPYIPMQDQNPKRYDNREALQRGTLFPGLDLPFHRELKTRFPAANTHLSELMALDFAIDELGLYLVTHADDKEVLDLYWKYIALAKEGRARYQEQYGPLTQTAVTEGGYKWLNDPWPWDEGGSD